MNLYDTKVAEHYAAYRPPLHKDILAKALGESTFDLGLDVGSGTGQSSIALLNHCKKVIGLEPNAAMRMRAIPNANVEYKGLPEKLSHLEQNGFDVMTFAGSWSYAKSQELLDEIWQVTLGNGKILIYDFVVDLDSLFLNIFDREPEKSFYDFQVNFDGLSHKFIEEEPKEYKQSFEILPEELVHLFLADLRYVKKLPNHLNDSNLNLHVLSKFATKATLTISADVCFKVYSKN